MNHSSRTIVIIAIALGFIILTFIAYKVFIIHEAVANINSTISMWNTELNND